MYGPDRHLGNITDGPLVAGCTAVARRRLPALVVLASLLLFLAFSQSSPGGGSVAGVSAAAASTAGRSSADLSIVGETPERTLFAPEGDVGIRAGKFGASVALSGDGQTALIGAPYEDGGPEQNEGPGSAWVFTRSDGEWTQPQELPMPAGSAPGECGNETPEDGGEDQAAHACRYGISVALSQDGDTAVIGAPHARNNGGAVFVFTRTAPDAPFALAKELTDPTEGVDDRFGRSVAVSAAGTTILVGAPMGAGRAIVLTGSGSTWTKLAELVNPVKSGAESESEGGGMFGAHREGEGEGKGLFGQSVALSTDGQTALVGAPGYPGQKGAAWVFHDFGPGEQGTDARLEVAEAAERPGEGEAEKHAREAREDEAEREARFGFAVALSGDGGTALVGAPKYEGRKGAAWIFAGAGEGPWSERAKPVGEYTSKAEEEASGEEEFGGSVALSQDGDTALIGAANNHEHHGAAWLFKTPSGLAWGEQGRLQAEVESRPQVRFGSGVALSSDAGTRLVGGRSDEHKGAAWVFGPNPSVAAVNPNKGLSAGGTTVTIAGEHLVEAKAVWFGETKAASFSVTSDKSIVAVSPPGTGTVQVRVETPIGLSEKNPPNDRFTYTKEEGGKGEGGKGKGEEIGESKQEGGQTVSQNGTTGPAPKGEVLNFGPLASGACGVSLVGKRFSVNSHSRAVVKLRGAGAGKCAGKLTLRIKIAQAKIAGKTIVKLRSIGTANFAIVAGQTRAVSIKLNAAGRLLLKAGHGHLNTSLLIVKSSPAPVRARSASVRLTQAKLPTKAGVKKA